MSNMHVAVFFILKSQTCIILHILHILFCIQCILFTRGMFFFDSRIPHASSVQWDRVTFERIIVTSGSGAIRFNLCARCYLVAWGSGELKSCCSGGPIACSESNINFSLDCKQTTQLRSGIYLFFPSTFSYWAWAKLEAPLLPVST